MRKLRIRRRRARALALACATALVTTTATIAPLTGAAGAAEQRYATIQPGKDRVAFGKRVVMRGRFPDAPNATVEIRHRRAAGERFVKVTTATTDSAGRFQARVKPRSTGVWRAQLANPQRVAPASTSDGITAQDARAVDTKTGSDRVVVRSRTSARVSDKHVLAGRTVEVKGTVRPGGPRRVIVKAGGRRISTRANRHGRFSVDWRVPSTGKYRVKVRAKGNHRAAASGDRAGKVIAYRKAFASYYGPGLYGNRTACGQTLTPDTLGVAHKTMPCGTKLTLRHGSKSVNVRVIDRGPYAAGREFDLTEATKNRLGFGSTGYILTSK